MPGLRCRFARPCVTSRNPGAQVANGGVDRRGSVADVAEGTDAAVGSAGLSLGSWTGRTTALARFYGTMTDMKESEFGL